MQTISGRDGFFIAKACKYSAGRRQLVQKLRGLVQ